MCLFPRIIKNPRYIPNKKNGGHPEKPKDKRTAAVAIGCGKCIECRTQLANSWRIRLSEELESNPMATMVTLTFTEESLKKLRSECEENCTENDIATLAVRRFLERWRKNYHYSCRHWLITELGHNGTERLHLHGILFCDKVQELSIEKIWGYGFIKLGTWVNLQTINYLIKYVTKIDNDHPNYEQKILCSPGIGNSYLKKKARFNSFNDEETKEYYLTKNGHKLGLPIYYRNHIYTEEEKEKLWINKLDKKTIYVRGTPYKVDNEENIKIYLKALKTAQKDNKKNGYGGINWSKKDYKIILKDMNKKS